MLQIMIKMMMMLLPVTCSRSVRSDSHRQTNESETPEHDVEKRKKEERER
jgi:hypothetical protein